MMQDTLSADELADLRDAVRGEVSRQWPDATVAPTGDLAALWATAARQGWTSFDRPEYDQAATSVQTELGAIACPLPVVDIALVNQVLHSVGHGDLLEQVAAGECRPVIALGDLSKEGGRAAHIEAGTVATHLLVIDPERQRLAWCAVADADVEETPGLPVPAWSHVTVLPTPEWAADLSVVPDLLTVRRLGLAARAVAAARRSHELALEHAKQREQFGKPIGSFQAVSHRLVNAEIALTSAAELLGRIHELRNARDDSWELAAEVYLEFVASTLGGLQFDAHHTLAAVGYFEEHQAPWLFRRIHADLAVLAATPRVAGVGERLLQGAKLPETRRGEAADTVRREVIEAFSRWIDGPPSHLRSWDDEARAVLRDHEWIGVGWPEEIGGRGWDVTEVLAFSEAIAYVNPPVGNIWMGINSIIPMLLGVGTPELRDLVIDEVRKGELSIALAYSEPEAGSDLASLRTRAERTEGGWTINGQKMWGTSFPDSKWCVLAARTDPEAKPPHAGISLFLVDTDSPGLEISPHTALGGDVSATTFWDDVFVPDDRLIGAVNEGWRALGKALAGERVLIGASVMRAHRAFDRLVAMLAATPESVVPNRRDDVHREIGRIAVRLEAARALVELAVRSVSHAGGSQTAAPMAKIAATELAEDLNASAISLLGPDALAGWGVPGGVGDGYFEDGLRASIMGVVAGGTGDIQRNLVARGLGLPR